MKFDAWPVEPPGLGRAPLSSCTMSRQPSRARWCTRLLPTMPAPITTTRAVAGRFAMMILLPLVARLAVEAGQGRGAFPLLGGGAPRVGGIGRAHPWNPITPISLL